MKPQDRLNALRKLGYSEDHPEVKALLGASQGAQNAEFEANYKKWVLEMRKAGLIAQDTASHETASDRVREILAGAKGD